MSREKKLDNAVLEFIESQGGWSIKYWAGARYTKKGIPDILACIDGYFFGIEDKASGGKPTMLQLKNLEWIDAAGGFGILLYPDQFENFKRFINYGLNNLNAWQEEWYVENIALQYEWREKLEKMYKKPFTNYTF